MSDALRASGLRHRFGRRQVLDGVDLRVGAGGVVAVLGRNGAGKSTLLRILATSLAPHEGELHVAGVDARADPARARRSVGLLLTDERTWEPELDATDNLAVPAALQGLGRRAARRRIEELLLRHGLADLQHPVGRWSTGQLLRLALVRALLAEPRLLLLDEPARSLDPAAREKLRAELRRLADEDGVALVVVTHDLDEVDQLGAEAVVLRSGRLTRAGRGLTRPSVVELLRG